MAIKQHHGKPHPRNPKKYDLKGEFSDYQASWYISAAYFYKHNKPWCIANGEKFWEKFFGGSDDDTDYYQPDYDIYDTKYGEGDDDEEEEEITPNDKAIIERYHKEREKFSTPMAGVKDPHPFSEYATPAFVILVWDNIKHDPMLVEGANFFLVSQAF